MPSTADTRVDLQFHVLPGVDDGPATLEQSLRIADLAVATALAWPSQPPT
jgi:tyrosine-protein phosphatase YwqE